MVVFLLLQMGVAFVLNQVSFIKCLDDDILHVNMLKKIDDSTTYIIPECMYYRRTLHYMLDYRRKKFSREHIRVA